MPAHTPQGAGLAEGGNRGRGLRERKPWASAFLERARLAGLRVQTPNEGAKFRLRITNVRTFVCACARAMEQIHFLEQVRGPKYLSDKKKVASEACLYATVGLDILFNDPAATGVDPKAARGKNAKAAKAAAPGQRLVDRPDSFLAKHVAAHGAGNEIDPLKQPSAPVGPPAHTTAAHGGWGKRFCPCQARGGASTSSCSSSHPNPRP